MMKRTLEALREREAESPVVFVLEDLDELNRDAESSVLEFMDGAEGTSNVLFIATTNYISKLPSRLSKRPGRFDTTIEVPHPDVETRIRFISRLLSASEDDERVHLYAKAEQVHGRSLAHVREFVVYNEIYRDPNSQEVFTFAEFPSRDDDDDYDDDE